MKKTLFKFAAALLTLCLAISALSGMALAATVYASDGNSYIRSQPNLSGEQLATLPEGESANYLGQSSVDTRGVNWYFVSYKGVTGWISSTYTTLSGSYNDYDGYGGYEESTVYASGGDSYIRSQPSLSGMQLALFPDGASATFEGRSSVDERDVRWYYVSYRGTTGWVSSRYTTLEEAYEPVYEDLYAVGGDTYIRSQPNLSGEQLALFPEGAVATFLDRSSVDERGVTWYRIFYRDTTGWVSSKYTSFSEDGDDRYEYAVADGGSTYIRSSASTDARSLGTMHEGETALYLGETQVDMNGRSWYKIRYVDITGWVSSRYTSLY